MCHQVSFALICCGSDIVPIAHANFRNFPWSMDSHSHPSILRSHRLELMDYVSVDGDIMEKNGAVLRIETAPAVVFGGGFLPADPTSSALNHTIPESVDKIWHEPICKILRESPLKDWHIHYDVSSNVLPKWARSRKTECNAIILDTLKKMLQLDQKFFEKELVDNANRVKEHHRVAMKLLSYGPKISFAATDPTNGYIRVLTEAEKQLSNNPRASYDIIISQIACGKVRASCYYTDDQLKSFGLENLISKFELKKPPRVKKLTLSKSVHDSVGFVPESLIAIGSGTNFTTFSVASQLGCRDSVNKGNVSLLMQSNPNTFICLSELVVDKSNGNYAALCSSCSHDFIVLTDGFISKWFNAENIGPFTAQLADWRSYVSSKQLDLRRMQRRLKGCISTMPSSTNVNMADVKAVLTAARVPQVVGVDITTIPSTNSAGYHGGVFIATPGFNKLVAAALKTALPYGKLVSKKAIQTIAKQVSSLNGVSKPVKPKKTTVKKVVSARKPVARKKAVIT